LALRTEQVYRGWALVHPLYAILLSNYQ